MKHLDLKHINRHVYICCDENEYKHAIRNKYKRDFDEWLNADGETRDLMRNYQAFVTTVFNPETRYEDVLMYFNIEQMDNLCKDKYEIMNVISHECSHVTVALRKSIGCPVSEEADEDLAYSTGNMVEEVYRYLDTMCTIK